MALTKAHFRMIDGTAQNIIDFGADPTGTTNSSVAIQAALDAGNSVYIPDGTYLLTSPIQPNDNQFIFGSGTLKLSASIVGSPFYVTFGGIQQYANSAIFCNGVENITIKDITVDVTDVAAATNYIRLGIIFFNYTPGSYKENFTVENVTFHGEGLGMFCNVQNCLVTNCRFFDNVNPALSFETVYPNSGATPYQYPIGLTCKNNFFETSLHSENSATVWLSGFKDVIFEGNNLSANGTVITVYVNDLSIGINNIQLSNNIINQKATTANSLPLVQVMGRAFISPATVPTIGVKGIMIFDNTFKSDTDYAAQTTSQVAGISAIFPTDMDVSGNAFYGLYNGISLTDHYSTTYALISRVNIVDNRFVDLANYGVSIGDTLETIDILSNYFENWGKQSASFLLADQNCIDIRKIRNVQIVANTFYTNDAVSRERLINAERCVDCKIEDNKNLATLNASEVASTAANSYTATWDGQVIDNAIYRIYMTNGRNSFGTFKIGDVNRFPNSPFSSGGNNYVEQICTVAGINSPAITETATGTSGNNYFAASSTSGELRWGQTVTIDGNAYEITDIDYYANKFYVSPNLSTTFAAAAITVSAPTFQYTTYYV